MRCSDCSWCELVEEDDVYICQNPDSEHYEKQVFGLDFCKLFEEEEL